MAQVFDVRIIAAIQIRQAEASTGIHWASSFPRKTAREQSTRRSAYNRDDVFGYFFANIFRLVFRLWFNNNDYSLVILYIMVQ